VSIELAILKNKQDGEYGPPPPSSEPVSPPALSEPASTPKKEFYNPPPHQAAPPQNNPLDQNSNTVKMVQEMVGRVKVNNITHHLFTQVFFNSSRSKLFLYF
jgi:hypothetical protein